MSSEMPASGGAASTSPRTDLIVAALLLAFGLTVIVLSLRMPTFGDAGSGIYTAPGIVPGFHGIVISVLSLTLGIRAILRARTIGEGEVTMQSTGGDRIGRLMVTAVLCLIFAMGLVGRLPFWLAVMLFVTAFIAIFEWRRDISPRARLRALLTALAQGIIAGIAVVVLFQSVFLVQLP